MDCAAVQMAISTCSMTIYEMMKNDIMLLLLMLAISLSIYENMTYLTTSE